MKTRQLILSGLIIILSHLTGFTQPDTIKIKANALQFADSLIKANTYKNWATYANLAPASVIKHYGGKEGYIEHIVAGRKRNTSDLEEEDGPQMQMEELLTLDEQWQCLIRISRYIHRDDKKLHVVTYFLGQSKDDGQTWRLFDISYNTVANIIYIFPEIFGDMAIPEPTLLTPEEELARQQAEAGPAAKKTTSKKK
jgi:hypothetical protein